MKSDKPDKKKSNRRSRSKYPALNPSLNLKTRYDELVDFDYIYKLNDEEKDFLNRFLEEWVNANMNHGGERLHKTKAERKLCYDRNNSRNRDMLSRAKASGSCISMNNLKETESIQEEQLYKKLEASEKKNS